MNIIGLNRHNLKDICRFCLCEKEEGLKNLNHLSQNNVKYSEMLAYVCEGLKTEYHFVQDSIYFCNLCNLDLEQAYSFKKRYAEIGKMICSESIDKNAECCESNEFEHENNKKLKKHLPTTSAQQNEVEILSDRDVTGCAFLEISNKSEAKVTENNSAKYPKEDKMEISLFCTKCNINFLSAAESSCHWRNYHELMNRPYQCGQCEKQFILTRDFKKHNIEDHNIDKMEERNCRRCGLKFKRITDYRKHYQSSHKSKTVENLFTCLKCEMKFNSKMDFTKHCRQIHKDDDVRSFECRVCKLKFQSKSDYNLHKSMCLHTCYQCNIQFDSIKKYSLHWRKVHESKKSYLCAECGKSFKFYSSFRQHQKIHSGDRSYKCTQCEKEFIHRTSHRRHMISHSGEKRYSCRFCMNKYSSDSVLREHIRVHTGERPYKCSICSKYFKKRQTLKNHIVTHTKERNAICKICEKSYGTKASLYVHMKIHLKKEENVGISAKDILKSEQN